MSNSSFGAASERRPTIRSVLVLGLVVGLVAACSSSASPTPAPKDKIVFGTVPIAGTASVYVGKDQGFFDEANIDVEVANAVQFANIVGDVVAGTYNFGTVSVGTAANAIIEGIPIKIVGNTYYSAGEQQLMVLSSGPIKTIKDLEGKHIGLGGLNNNFQSGIIEQMTAAGVDVSTIEFTLISPPDIPAALRNGVIDAGQINEPFIVQAGDEFFAVIPKPFAPYGDQPCNNYVIAKTDWLDANRELAERFLAAYDKGGDYAAANKAAVIKAVMSFSEVPEATLQNMTMPGYASGLYKDSFQKTIQGMFDEGFLKRLVTVDEAFWQYAPG
jgi:NitT/TauT family transport system substrate-binding protein